MSRCLVSLFAIAPLLAAGCGQEPALEIVFKTNLKLNTPRQVAEAVEIIDLVVSSANGVYPAGKEVRDGTVQVYDRDGDSLPDLVATIDMTQMHRLPVVRLQQGGMDVESPLDINVEGFASAADRLLVASGSVPGVEFPPESIDRITLQFDLFNRYLPPRVLQTQLVAGVATLQVVFSKAMEVSSLNQDTIRVYRLTDGDEVLVPAKAILPFVVPGDNPTTNVQYQFYEALEAGIYRINVTTGARDASPDQRPLDTVPAEPGNQEYNAPFTISSASAEPNAPQE